MGSVGGAADKRLKTLIMKLNPQLRQGMQPYEHTSSARFLGNSIVILASVIGMIIISLLIS